MRQRIYVETTIPSFYFDTRTSPEMVAMKLWTRRFWDEERDKFDLFTAAPVIDELRAAPSPKRELTLALIEELPVLEATDAVLDAIVFYLAKKLMPAGDSEDAAHLAFASVHGCEWLLTWNCAHLANARKFEHIRAVNELLGLRSPGLITPMQLLTDEKE